MKHTFYKLEESKRERIEAAAVGEFADKGYDRSTLDAIVRRAGISKGGLYEYIDTKEDLFSFALESSYNRMRDFIRRGLSGVPPQGDPLLRARSIASVAVDFYVEHPLIISFLTAAAVTENPQMRRLARNSFTSYFEGLFGDCDFTPFRFGRLRVIDTLGWILVKTRTDFTERLRETGESEGPKRLYLEDWDYYVSAIGSGIYRDGPRASQ